jgi:DHA2 family multidrug resistance protein-like MFS transporter
VRAIFPRHLAGRGIGYMSVTVAVGAALGPTVAASILSVASWRWLFAVNVPIGAIAVALSLVFLPSTPTSSRPFDAFGSILNALMFALVIIGLEGLGNAGGAWIAALEVAAGLVAAGGLVLHQRLRRAPLLPLDLLTIPIFALSVITSICSYATQTLAYVSLPFLLEHTFHRSEVATGFLITPWPLVIVFVAPLAGRMSDRYPAGVLSSIGLAIMAVGLATFATLPAAPSDLDIVWRMAVCGIGFGFFQTPNNRVLLMSGPPQRSGAASGMMATARLIGMTTGAALVAVIFELAGTGGAMTALLVGAGIAGAGVVVSCLRLFDRTGQDG